MGNNVLEILKEKKNLMKLSMVTLVSAASICVGPTLFSANAMIETPAAVSGTQG